MLKTWNVVGIYEGQLFVSTHLTEKGALLNAIGDIIDFLGLTDDPGAALDRFYSDDESPPCHDMDVIREMDRGELRGLFHAWATHTLDNRRGYQIEVIKSEVTV